VKGERRRAADRELAALIRRSDVLDAAAKRSWLRILPHLTSTDLARLREIFRAEAAEPWLAPPEDATRP